MSEPEITRAECDLMALRYLRDSGPDEIGVVDSEEKLAAAMIYIDLKRRGLADSRSPKRGVVYWDITPAGVTFLGAA